MRNGQAKRWIAFQMMKVADCRTIRYTMYTVLDGEVAVP